MMTAISPNPLYDLTNKHFAKVQLTLNDNTCIKGRFVQFKVVKDKVEYLFPSEKYCFLPDAFESEFNYFESKYNGEFTEFPKYVMQLGLHQIKSFTIQTSLV